MRTAELLLCRAKLDVAAAFPAYPPVQLLAALTDREPAAVFVLTGSLLGRQQFDHFTHRSERALGIVSGKQALSARLFHFSVTSTTEQAGSVTVNPP